MRKTYKFLYVPEDHESSRVLSLPGHLLAGIGVLGVSVALMAGLYVAGLFQGTSWLPGGSRVQRENVALSARVDHLGGKVAMLRENLQESYRLQEMVTVAMGLDPLDPNVREAGIGGRGLVERRPTEVPGEHAVLALNRDLDAVLRQARVQHDGYRALLDTLTRRADVLARLPSIRPVDIGWLSSSYGYRPDPFTKARRFHKGLDYSVPTGTPVRATADGVVTAVKRDRGYGMVVRLEHGDGLSTMYAHMSAWHVKSGQRVKRGQVIGLSGNTGRSTAPHLHYEVKRDGRHVNPMPFVLDSYATR